MVEKSTADLLANLETLEATQEPLAQLLKSKFDFLVTAGFNAEQALAIVCARGVEP